MLLDLGLRLQEEAELKACDRMEAANWGIQQAKEWIEELGRMYEAGATDDELYAHWETVPKLRRSWMFKQLEKLLESIADA